MKYDFQTAPDRSNCGAAKWMQMKRFNPNVEEGIIPFSVADMELKNPPELIEDLKQYLDGGVLGYTLPTKSYFDAVCGCMERRHEWKIRPEWILQWPGIVPALYDLVRMLTEAGDNVVIMTPVYYPFYEAVQNGKRNLLESPLKCENGHYSIDFADLEAKVKLPKTKLLILCNPHNPVGRSWTKEELEQIGTLCAENQVLVISDEIHFDLMMPGYKHTVFASVSEECRQNCIICTAPSKTFHVAGLQISNIIIPNQELCEKVRALHKQEGFFSLNSLAYRACETLYGKCEGWLEELLRLIAHNRDAVSDFLHKRIPEIIPYEMEATYLLWLDCRKLGMAPKELETFMHEKAQLFLDEGYLFGKAGEGFERLNLACPTIKLLEAMERLEKALQNLGIFGIFS